MDSTGLALALAAFGVVLIGITYRRHRNRRHRSALLHGLCGALLFIGGALLLATSMNFATYTHLRQDQPLAELSVVQSGAHNFSVRLLRIPSGDLQIFILKGERWQVQARLLTWQGWPTQLGLNSNVRLEQLNSLDSSQKNSADTANASSYTLSPDPGLRLWAWQEKHPNFLSTLTTNVVLSEPMPLKDGLRFHLFIVDGKLVARQINTVVKPTTDNKGQTSIPLRTFSDEFNRQLLNREEPTDDVTEEVPAVEPVPE